MRVIPAGSDLELRPVCAADASALFSAAERNLERLRPWLEWAVVGYSLQDMRRFVDLKQAENSSGDALTAGIWSRGTLCGAIELHRINWRHRSSSIGYWVDCGFEGKGIVTRACQAIVSEAFTGFGLHRIEIRCATGNHRSAAVAKRLGFVQEAVLSDAEWLHDHWVDLYLFRMLEQDWPAPDSGTGT
jgi:ribosomal-protein-serine acetyltransferase